MCYMLMLSELNNDIACADAWAKGSDCGPWAHVTKLYDYFIGLNAHIESYVLDSLVWSICSFCEG